MPIKKPKEVKLPAPFANQAASDDPDARRRAILMQRELERGEGFSWNQPQQGFIARIRTQPLYKTVFAVASMGMGMLLVASFLIRLDSGIDAPERVVYVESWRTDRSAEDAVAEQTAAMDKLRAQIAENRRVHAAEQTRLKALEAERAAARQATS